jgi:signal transduction histidine kinase/DNA-binding NarL/FixJ family response regulator
MFNSLKARVLLLIVGIVVITSAAFMMLANKEIVSAMNSVEEDSAKNSLRLIMMHIEHEYHNLHSFKESSLNAHKRELKNILTMQETYMRELFNQVQKGLIKEDEAKRRVSEETSSFRFGKKDYIWIVDYNAMVISHANLKLVGKDFSQVRDVQGKLVVPPMIEIARKNGEGFHSYLWTRLNTEAPVEKLAYARLFPEWKWVIGTGVYIDDIETEARQKYDSTVNELEKTLSKIKIARTGYFYIFNGDGKMLIHPGLSGKDVSKYKNPVSGTILVNDLMEASKKPDKPFRYLWDKPDDKGNYTYPKVSYAAYFKPLDWYIVSSAYEDEINAPAETLENKILITFVLILLAAIIISIVFASTITVPIRKLIAAMKGTGKGELPSTTVKSSGTVETKELGNIFNSMMSSIHETTNEKEKYEKRLEKAYYELEIRVEERTKELSVSNTQLKNEIMERKKAEEDMRKAKLEAEEANTMKSRFMANMSHEIRTPLNGIIGFSESIMSSSSIDDTRSYGETILRESGTLLELINEILDHAKTESGKIVLENRTFDMHLFLDRIKSVSYHSFIEKGLEYNFHADNNIPQYVLGDSLRLRQVLMNLINNAVKFTDKGSITVNIKTAEIDSKYAALRFSVTDTGIGIPEEKQSSIFQSFTQADDSTTRKYGGTGLGTTISKELTELMGGEIGLVSKPGEGSTFWFTVTLEISKIPPADGDDSSLSTGKTCIKTREIKIDKKGSILLAEDYKPNYEVVRLHLKDTGHTLKIAENGRDAVAVFEGGKFDLVFMDVQMPEMDGYEATRHIRGSDPDAIIIGMTANVDFNTRKACLEAGMNDVITKPIRRMFFLKTINKWLAKKDSDTKRSSEYPAAENISEIKKEGSPIEYKLAVKEFEGEEEILKKVIKDFVETAGLQIQQIKAALDSKDMQTIKREAHKIKGGASNLVAMPLSTAAAQLEKESGNGKETATEESLNQLEKEYEYFVNYVSELDKA